MKISNANQNPRHQGHFVRRIKILSIKKRRHADTFFTEEKIEVKLMYARLSVLVVANIYIKEN